MAIARGWASLGQRARVWRIAHAAWSVGQLGALGLIWSDALTRRRRRATWLSVAFLSVEGVGLLAGRGGCPMADAQASWGDPVPFFELVLPPRAAKAAVPALAIVAVAGIAMLVVRQPGLVAEA